MELNNISALVSIKFARPSASGIGENVRIEGAEKESAPLSEDQGAQEAKPSAFLSEEAPAKTSTEDQQAAAEALKAVAEAKAKMAPLVMHSVNFQVDDSTGETVINVINAETKEVIRQIPPEELQQIAKNIDNINVAPKGVVVDREG